MFQIIFGSKNRTNENGPEYMNFKDECHFLEKLVKSGIGLIDFIKTMKKIAFGNENIDDSYIYLTEENLKGKCLIEIIEDFKNMREKEQKQQETF